MSNEDDFDYQSPPAKEVIYRAIIDPDELAALRADAERYRWLRDVTDERPVNEKAYFSELAPDKRLLFNFPKLQAYNCIGQQFTLDEAVDAAIAAGRES